MVVWLQQPHVQVIQEQKLNVKDLQLSVLIQMKQLTQLLVLIKLVLVIQLQLVMMHVIHITKDV
jgi:hypothetical protein